MANNFVCIDLGASSTRVSCKDRLVHEIPNNVRSIPMDKDIHMATWDATSYEESVLNALDVTIIRHEGANEYLCAEERLLAGTIADRYGSTSRPTSLEPKHRQPINYKNAVIATAFQMLMSPWLQKNTSNGPVPLTIFVALPPIECKGNEKILQDNLTGTYTVKFNSVGETGTTVHFQIQEVRCNAESLLSLLHFFFDSNASLRTESMKYSKGNTLSVDIGASTTDLTVMKNGKYIEKSGYTIPIGGNQIRDYVMNEVQLKYGFMPTIADADYIVQTGMVNIGAGEQDFSAELRQGKEEFAIMLVDRLNAYFKQISMSLASFMCVAIGGGGSLHSCVGSGNNVKITTPALSEIVMGTIHRLCPEVDVVPVPGNPRHANVNGLLVFALVWEQRANSANTQPTRPAPVATQYATTNGANY